MSFALRYFVKQFLFFRISLVKRDPPEIEKKRFQCYCWIIKDWVGYVLYGIYIIFMIIIIFTCKKTSDYLKNFVKERNNSTSKIDKHVRNEEVKKLKEVYKLLLLFPFVSIIIWTPALASRSYEMFYFNYLSLSDTCDTPKIIRLILYSIQAIVSSGRGLGYITCYVFNYGIMKAELKLIKKSILDVVFCRKCVKNEQLDSDSNLKQSLVISDHEKLINDTSISSNSRN